MRIEITNVEGRTVYKKTILNDHPELLAKIMDLVNRYESDIDENRA